MRRFLTASIIVVAMSQLAWAEYHELSPSEDVGRAIAHYVGVMTSEMEPWEVRCEAEDALRGFDVEPVLRAVLGHVSKGMPQPPIWNSAGREHDRDAPVE